jgi:hypothetical protein
MSATSSVRDPIRSAEPAFGRLEASKGGPTIAGPRFIPMFRGGGFTMLLALGVVLAVGWVLAFFVLHVTAIAIHVLAFGAALCAIVHFIHVRHTHHRPQPRL